MQNVSRTAPTVAVVTHESSGRHVTPDGHPESVARIEAVEAALGDERIAASVSRHTARQATDAELAVVHRRDHIDQIRVAVEMGLRRVDPDTYTSAGSWDAALHAAGAGLTGVELLDANQDLEGAFIAARPPGHHATTDTAMGFCLFNNVAVTAAHLADRGERVLIVDWDVHHGNGTQAIFWNDPRVSFVSLHEANNYPHSGHLHERGGPDAFGTTTNLAMPSGATGDVYRNAIASVVEPLASSIEPTWVLISAGFDAHHLDPLSDMGMTAGDYATFTNDIRTFAPSTARTMLFLEGGYSLDGLGQSVTSSVAALANIDIEQEPPSSGGPGTSVVKEAAAAIARQV